MEVAAKVGVVLDVIVGVGVLDDVVGVGVLDDVTVGVTVGVEVNVGDGVGVEVGILRLTSFGKQEMICKLVNKLFNKILSIMPPVFIYSLYPLLVIDNVVFLLSKSINFCSKEFSVSGI